MASKRIQTSFRIEKQLLNEFRHALVDRDEKMTPVIEGLIRIFLAQRDGRTPESQPGSAVPISTKEECLTTEHWKLLRVLGNALQNLQQPKEASGSPDSEWAVEFIDQLPVVAVVKDLDYRVLWTNRAYCTLTNKPQSELIGKTAREIWGTSPDDLKYAEQILAHEKMVVTEKKPYQLVEDIVVGGKVRDRLALRFPIFDEDGEVVRIGVVSLDLPKKVRSSNPAPIVQYASRIERA